MISSSTSLISTAESTGPGSNQYRGAECMAAFRLVCSSFQVEGVVCG
jgi:hypothetical protein